MIEDEPFRKKPRVRVFPDGAVFRLWPGAFGATFPTGPHISVDEALAHKTYWLAEQEIRDRFGPPKSDEIAITRI